VIGFPNCKINLGLYILDKRADGFHNLETVFYPFGLKDGLEIIQQASYSEKGIEFTSSGLVIDAKAEDNISVKAYYLLKKDFPQLPGITMHLHKAIPTGAGLGGGSADGAYALLLINQKFRLGLTEKQLIDYALQLGSDCPFFIINKPCFATGRGENLEKIPLDLSKYKIVLVNPKIHVNTGWAFSQIHPSNQRTSLRETIFRPIVEWREYLKNDFEEPVFSHYPEIKSIKEQLYEHGAIYASMSGSGSTVYGLFEYNVEPQLQFPSHYFMKSI
jgi:4-diphosphocytidyl-2-C-methyl-D-erythritol kinase